MGPLSMVKNWSEEQPFLRKGLTLEQFALNKFAETELGHFLVFSWLTSRLSYANPLL